MSQVTRNINYISRDFTSFRNTLIDYAKTYFPSTYNDFTPNSPGMMFMEMVSYVGDVLSFYTDNQIQETFLQYARQQENIYSLAYMLGYRPKTTNVAEVDITLYQSVPSKIASTQTVPDLSYALYIPQNLAVGDSLGSTFFLIQDFVDFSYSSSTDPTAISVASIDNASGQPTEYVLSKTKKAISATIKTSEFSFNTPERFTTVTITDNNIVGILDIVDSAGNIWYEVPYLGQELVFTEIRNNILQNPNTDVQGASHLLRLEKQPRRFVTRFKNESNLEIQFGGGSINDSSEKIIPNNNNVGLGLPYKKSFLNTAFDPTNFLFTDTYGIAPSNTTLTVRYLVGGGAQSNISANRLTNIVDRSRIAFVNTPTNAVNAQYYFDSLQTTNLQAAFGGGDGDDLETIRQNSMKAFSAQLRTVTLDDYLVRALSLPSNYGSIAKAYIAPTKASESNTQSSIKTIDLYVLSYNDSKQLTQSSQSTKNNLNTYLSQYRMINEGLTIKDAFIVNIEINFDIVTVPGINSNEVLYNCIESLKNHFNIDKWSINAPIILRQLYSELDRIRGLETVKKIEIINKVGALNGYSQYAYDIKGATIDNIIYPSMDPMIFEVKYPDIDIKGRVVAL